MKRPALPDYPAAAHRAENGKQGNDMNKISIAGMILAAYILLAATSFTLGFVFGRPVGF